MGKICEECENPQISMLNEAKARGMARKMNEKDLRKEWKPAK